MKLEDILRMDQNGQATSGGILGIYYATFSRLGWYGVPGILENPPVYTTAQKSEMFNGRDYVINPFLSNETAQVLPQLPGPSQDTSLTTQITLSNL